MASQHTFGDQRQFRHRLKEINLQPDKSTYEIIVEIRVDGIGAHKLPLMKKGRLLRWTGLHLPCDVSENSEITLQITEVHHIRARDRIASATYKVSQVTDQNEVSIGCENGMFTIRMKFLDEEATKRAFAEAVEKVWRLEKQPGLPKTAGRVRDAFKALLTLGSTMADLDPTGSAKIVFSVCTEAWEHLEQRAQQDTDLTELVKSLARMIPSIESVKGLADDNLKDTVMDMLNLIEDVSLFILNSRPRSSFERAWRAAITSDMQEKTQAYITKFESLGKEFDRRVAVQSLRAAEIESKPRNFEEQNSTGS
ncbi:hypothetical protein FRC10_008124 [Ceratobasidium sp. 414]|nr:hypothetical protein FRC10_008124 [Ceratobasidium sp. 414]